MRPGHETRVSRIMSRVTIKWQDCSCCLTVSSWLPDRELSNDTLYCNNDKRYLVITPSPDASLDTCLLPALVLKDKFIVATFLRTSLLKISVKLCFILPWINWISESSLSSSRGMIRVLLVDFLWQTPGWNVSLYDDCMRWGWQEWAAHILTQSIRTWHLNLNQLRFPITLMDKSKKKKKY